MCDFLLCIVVVTLTNAAGLAPLAAKDHWRRVQLNEQAYRDDRCDRDHCFDITGRTW